jgi:biopolymer transport protein ExbB
VEPTPEQTNWLIKAFQDGGVTMYFIAAVGAVTAALIFVQFSKMKNLILDKEDFVDKLFAMILRGELRQAIAFCDAKSAPLSNTLKAGLVQVLNRRPDEEVQVAMDGAVLKETPRIEGWSALLAVLGNVATLLGLLGTIVGLIRSFGAIANMDPAQKALELSTGIAHALNCTAFGLAVAIPALVFYGYFQIRIGRAINDMAEASMNTMNIVVANRDKMKG